MYAKKSSFVLSFIPVTKQGAKIYSEGHIVWCMTTGHLSDKQTYIAVVQLNPSFVLESPVSEQLIVQF